MEEEIGGKNEEREMNGRVDEDGGLDGRGRWGRGVTGEVSFHSSNQKLYILIP